MITHWDDIFYYACLSMIKTDILSSHNSLFCLDCKEEKDYNRYHRTLDLALTLQQELYYEDFHERFGNFIP